MKFLLLFIFLLVHQQTDFTINRVEAEKAFDRLQRIRSNPTAYAESLQFPKTISASKLTLRWNDTLARVAEQKALDMAKRQYFSHTDPDGYGINYYIHKAGYTLNEEWLDKKENNNFESLAMNALNGEDGINILITDAGVPSKGHRIHLLGLNNWFDSCTDVGIGFVQDNDSENITYMCVIIAKHNW